MIGTDELEAVGIRRSGKRVPLVGDGLADLSARWWEG